MKKLVFLLLVISFQVSIAYGQACGGSTRTILLKDETGEKLSEKATYELFYLAPKNTGAEKNDYKRTAKFLSKFLFGDPDYKKGRFWDGYGEGNPFVSVGIAKAENYIKNYKLQDFEDFYTNRYNDHHLSQLKGSFADATVQFETRETDTTPFIMRIKSDKFEVLYLLSSFLGGCFNDHNAQTIQVNLISQ